MSTDNPLCVNYHDACLYKSDLDILRNEHEWLNSNLIHLELTRLSQVAASPPVVDPSIVSYLLHQCDEEDLVDFATTSELMRDPCRWLVPLNDAFAASSMGGGTHWSCLLLQVNEEATEKNDSTSKKSLQAFHLDSSHGHTNREAAVVVVKLWQRLVGYLEDGAEITNRMDTIEVPKQINSYDCGLHLLETARIILCTALVPEWTSAGLQQACGTLCPHDSSKWRSRLLVTFQGLIHDAEAS